MDIATLLFVLLSILIALVLLGGIFRFVLIILWRFLPSVFAVLVGFLFLAFVGGALGGALFFAGICTSFALYDSWHETNLFANGDDFIKDLFS